MSVAWLPAGKGQGSVGRLALPAAAALVAVLLTLFVARPAKAQAAAPAAPGAAAPADRTAAIELGRRTYIGMCARCHGINLVTQGIGFDLRRFPPDAQDRFRTSVTQGVRAMPAFGSSLSPVQIDGLWAYIGSVNGWSP